MKILSKLALIVTFLKLETTVSLECKEWCDDTPIPAFDENGKAQYCEFTDLCDGCDACNVEFVTACGSTAGACKNEPVKFESADTLHEVRCCSDTQLAGWQKQKTFCPWATSSIGGTCVHAETLSGADEKCTSAGGRLCTPEELLNDCTRGTGCSHDSDHIWTSSPAFELAEKTRTLVCGRAGVCNTETKESYTFVKNEVRCCSNGPLAKFSKKSGCAVWGGSEIPVCKHAETYDSAVDICGALGARLCTVSELQDNCTAGTGCGHDADFVWSLHQ